MQYIFRPYSCCSGAWYWTGGCLQLIKQGYSSQDIAGYGKQENHDGAVTVWKDVSTRRCLWALTRPVGPSFDLWGPHHTCGTLTRSLGPSLSTWVQFYHESILEIKNRNKVKQKEICQKELCPKIQTHHAYI